MAVRVQAAPFDHGAEVAALGRGEGGRMAPGIGAVVSFLGVVRDEGGTLSHMEIEHYPGMTERALAAIEAEAVERWSLTACLVIHRHGRLAAGEPIMMVATAARHRAGAFAAAEFLMDYLKSRAPFWKKEFGTGAEGAGAVPLEGAWVTARDEDEAALRRW